MARILLIEPDRLLAKHYLSALQAAGHTVTVCLSGQDGIQAADQATPELVILELQLKGHNGVEFLYEFRSYHEWQQIPVLVHSLVPEQALSGISTVPLLGINSYLYKPTTSLAKLIQAVDEALPSRVR